jgi:hypothetical protein
MAKWSGKLIDSTGVTGTVDLEVKDGDSAAVWRLHLASRDEVGEPMEGLLQLDGDIGKSEVHATGKEELPDGTRMVWELSLSPAPAGSYADAAITGSYAVSVDSDKSAAPLGRGVLVLWQFAE